MSKQFDKMLRLLDSGTRNIVQSDNDEFCKKNAEFRSKAGLEVTIIREALGECCSWCSDLEGVYTYDTAPNDVYARHRECNCVVSTRTKKGTYQDAWTKKEYKTYRENRIAREQELSKDTITSEQRKQLELALQDGGNAKIPEYLKGDYSDYLPLQISEEERKIFKKLKEMSDEDGFEHGAIIIKKGNVKYYNSNNANAVKMPTSEIDGTELKLYHSHTNDTPQSAADFLRLLEDKVDEVGVITRNGDAFIASVGNGWIPTEEEFEEIVKRISREVDNELIMSQNFFELTPQERNYVAIREQAYRICREFEWELHGGQLL